MFVPSDTAVQNMGMDRMNLSMKDKQMAMKMAKGLMMNGMIMPSDMTDGKTLNMMNGQIMTVRMKDDKMMLDGATVAKAIQANNGMIYVIDSIPSSMMSMASMGT